MEFLVRTELVEPLPQGRRDELLWQERAEGLRLFRSGLIAQMWRLPGQQANVAIMVADDATALHEAIVALPLWPYTEVTVEALATHPLTSEESAG